MRVSVIIPTCNEAQAIGRVLADLPSDLATEIIVDRLLARAQVLELSTGLTEPFYDIDVADDVIRLARELELAPARAPRTAAWFTEWVNAVAQLHHRMGEP